MTKNEWIAAVIRGVSDTARAVEMETVDSDTVCFSSVDAVCVLVATSDGALLATSYTKVVLDARQRIQHDEPVKVGTTNDTVRPTAHAIVDLLQLHSLA